MEQEYLVWSNEHGAWWRPKSAGYTRNRDEAGRYTRREAISICANARNGFGADAMPSEIPVPLDDLDEAEIIFNKHMASIK